MIKVETIVGIATAAVVGYGFGRMIERQAVNRRLLTQQVLHIGDVRGFLTPEQRQYLEALLDSGQEVLQERVGNMALVLVRAGGDQFERLFTVPALEGRQTLGEYDARLAAEQAAASDDLPSGTVI